MNKSTIKKTIKKLESELDNLQSNEENTERQDLITEAKLSLLVIAGCVDMLETVEQTNL